MFCHSTPFVWTVFVLICNKVLLLTPFMLSLFCPLRLPVRLPLLYLPFLQNADVQVTIKHLTHCCNSKDYSAFGPLFSLSYPSKMMKTARKDQLDVVELFLMKTCFVSVHLYVFWLSFENYINLFDEQWGLVDLLVLYLLLDPAFLVL